MPQTVLTLGIRPPLIPSLQIAVPRTVVRCVDFIRRIPPLTFHCHSHTPYKAFCNILDLEYASNNAAVIWLTEVPKILEPLSLRMATRQVNRELERQGVFARGNACYVLESYCASGWSCCKKDQTVGRVGRQELLSITTAELRTCETSNRDDLMYKDPPAVPGIEESPHLFEAPPITTTANIVINDSCNRDGCGSMARRNTQRMTEVAADRSLIVSQRDGRALLEGMLNRVISWMGEGRLVMG
ncbi:hypothetical protein BU17DRAFT_60536 [Hysterangium stoloniferum]|nr:hypothetical protein BU17DRAFT_60536 [Hysterangium stoloniferum]